MKTQTLFKHLLSLTLALSLGACATQPGSHSRATPDKPASSLAPLPEPVTSFAAVTDGGFAVALIPHTLAVTTLGRRRAGEQVNIEVDILAKYVERLINWPK